MLMREKNLRFYPVESWVILEKNNWSEKNLVKNFCLFSLDMFIKKNFFIF